MCPGSWMVNPGLCAGDGAALMEASAISCSGAHVRAGLIDAPGRGGPRVERGGGGGRMHLGEEGGRGAGGGRGGCAWEKRARGGGGGRVRLGEEEGGEGGRGEGIGVGAQTWEGMGIRLGVEGGGKVGMPEQGNEAVG